MKINKIMKKIDTAYISAEKADLAEIKYIIENIHNEEETEEWLCLFDTSKKNPNYIQVTTDFFEYEKDIPAIESTQNIFMIEFRRYQGEEFKHYRAFLNDVSLVNSCFEHYMNNELEEIENKVSWMDVTEEFLE